MRFDDSFHLVSDPIRRPQDILASLISPIGSLIDKVNVGVYSLFIRGVTLDEIYAKDECNTKQFLENRGLSSAMIDRFFSPFYQGIFLSPLKFQSSRMFEFVFKMFTQGAASLPENGMGAIGRQLADGLPITYNTVAKKLDIGLVQTTDADGKALNYRCETVIVATDPPSAARLLQGVEGVNAEALLIPEARGSLTLYFGIDGTPPVKDPILILNGENNIEADKPSPVLHKINNVCFPSQISRAYAPEGKTLASVTVIGTAVGAEDSEVETAVRAQLLQWWGDQVDQWKLLKIYRIPYAQPAQTPPYAILGQPVQLTDNLFICGDHRGTATLNGAIESGRYAARSALGFL